MVAPLGIEPMCDPPDGHDFFCNLFGNFFGNYFGSLLGISLAKLFGNFVDDSVEIDFDK